MSGSRLLALPPLISLGLFCAGTPVQAKPLIKAAQKKAAKKAESHAIIAGTVFRDPGFALPGAKVELWVRGGKKKLQESTTSPRGEFSFRVPPDQTAYLIKASMNGYQPEEKEAEIAGEERIDVNLVLSPESKP